MCKFQSSVCIQKKFEILLKCFPHIPHNTLTTFQWQNIIKESKVTIKINNQKQNYFIFVMHSICIYYTKVVFYNWDFVLLHGGSTLFIIFQMHNLPVKIKQSLKFVLNPYTKHSKKYFVISI